MKKLITTLGIALLLCSTSVMASDRAESFSTITMANYDKATPLAIAIAKGDVESVKAFIQYGVNIDETSNDMTPLMIAARYNQVVIINLLLEHGASKVVKNSKGFTALKYAQLSNAQQAVAFLKA